MIIDTTIRDVIVLLNNAIAYFSSLKRFQANQWCLHLPWAFQGCYKPFHISQLRFIVTLSFVLYVMTRVMLFSSFQIFILYWPCVYLRKRVENINKYESVNWWWPVVIEHASSKRMSSLQGRSIIKTRWRRSEILITVFWSRFSANIPFENFRWCFSMRVCFFQSGFISNQVREGWIQFTDLTAANEMAEFHISLADIPKDCTVLLSRLHSSQTFLFALQVWMDQHGVPVRDWKIERERERERERWRQQKWAENRSREEAMSGAAGAARWSPHQRRLYKKMDFPSESASCPSSSSSDTSQVNPSPVDRSRRKPRTSTSIDSFLIVVRTVFHRPLKPTENHRHELLRSLLWWVGLGFFLTFSLRRRPRN